MYTVEKNAIKNGNIKDNFEFLFTEANKVKTRFIRGHLNTLLEYSTRCETVVEMGVDTVNSTWAFLMSRPKKLVSYDISDKKGKEFIDLVKDLALKENIQYEFVLADTTKIEIEPADFLFIDTLHTYNQLKQELKLHSNKINRYIAFHDTHNPIYNDMNRAWKEFLNENSQKWKICYDNESFCGLTIIERQ